MKKLLYPLLFLIPYVGIGQSISVDQNNTTGELVNILLDNACANVTNSLVSSLQSISYFNNNSGAFPISEGIIIRSGNASYTAGIYTGNNLSSQENTNSSSYLEELNNASGQNTDITDVAFLEFEFTPLSKKFSFDFLFASNEYGMWQCVSSDVFAFVLTDLTTGETTNLALVPGENGNSLTVSTPATYSVVVSDNISGCELTDEIIFTETSTQAPEDLRVCYDALGNYTFNLLDNSYQNLEISAGAYEIVYYASQQDLNINNPIPEDQLPNYNGQANQTIYIKLISLDTNLYCDAVYNFKLLVNDPIVLTPPNIQLCETPSMNFVVDLNQNNSDIVANANDYNFYFYESYIEAETNAEPILDAENYVPTISNNSQTIWMRVENSDMPECSQIGNFEIIVNSLPLLNPFENIIECSEYTLPPITYGNYYTGSQGTGDMMFAGDVIDEEGTYFIGLRNGI